MEKPRSTAPGSTQAVDAISAFLEGQSTSKPAPVDRDDRASATDIAGASDIIRALADGPRTVSDLQVQLHLDFTQFASVMVALTNAGLVSTTKRNSDEQMELTSQGTALLPMLGG